VANRRIPEMGKGLRSVGRVVAVLVATAFASGFTAAQAAPSGGIQAQATAEELLHRGVQQYEQQDYAGAITDLDEALRLDPSWAAAYSVRALARLGLGDHRGAIGDLDEALRLNPSWAAAYGVRGEARILLGDYGGAIADYTAALRINPDHLLSYINRGVARSQLGDFEGAVADYDEVLRRDPDIAIATFNREQALARPER
jgi:tetratricopeptide (TPR) repeat protein